MTAALLVVVLALAESPGVPAVPVGTLQLVLVTTQAWDAPVGRLTRWERPAGGAWQRAGGPVDVLVGAAGLAWGRGLHEPAAGEPVAGPMKREGDRRGPAGVFRLGEAFGYATRPDPGVRWPYRALTPGSMCVDDPESPAYNKLVEAPAGKGAKLAKPPWRSAERMRYAGASYRRGLLIEHNSPDAQPGAGSCMFIHVRPPRGKPTSGCTAMASSDLEALLVWLRPEAHPVLVQAPATVHAAHSRRWGAPGPALEE